MDSIHPALPQEDYIWAVPSIPVFNQEDAGPSNSSSLRQSSVFHPYEAFHALDKDAPQTSNAFDHRNLPYRSPEDTSMSALTDTRQEEQPLVDSQAPPAPIIKRPRYGNLNWDKHREELKRLYLDQDLSLKDTMSIMKDTHSFTASPKLYKERFKSWGWQKNLPGEYAHWMTQKASKRKRDDGKETVFFYGGLQWDKSDAARSANRFKKARNGSDIVVVDTPMEIHYETPKDTVLSPQNMSSSVASRRENQNHSRQTVVEMLDTDSESESEEENVSLNWQGHSISELDAIFESARNHVGDATPEKVENMFLETLSGYRNLLGRTHEDTVKVAFTLASFYVVQDRQAHADKILDDISRSHIAKLGIEHRRTQQLILQIAELLNGWNRHADALAFLARHKEFAEAESDSGSSPKTRRLKVPRGKKHQHQVGSSISLMDVAQEIISDKTPTQVEHGIELARARVAVKDEAAEAFLKAIIDICESGGEALKIQNIQAKSELLTLYHKLGKISKQRDDFLRAIETSTAFIRRQKWNKKSFQDFEMMEALLKLSASILKAGFEYEATEMFKKIEIKAEDGFGWDEERTVWAKITIGIIYQNHKDWGHAKPWFERALAASMAANGEEDGITMALEAAMEKRNFSYLSDEGRPFKTIFGVSGLTIRPNRLHLE